MFRKPALCLAACALVLTACGAASPTAAPPIATGLPEIPRIIPTSADITTPTAAPASTPAAPTAVVLPTLTPTAGWSLYHDEDAGFSLQVPSDWAQDGNYFSWGMEDGPTNLFRKELVITWWDLPAECNHPAAGAIESISLPQPVLVNGITFTMEQGMDQGMNKIHELTSFSTPHGNRCVCITFKLHSTKPGVYDSPPPEFDRDAEFALFEEILSTLRFDP